MLKIGFLDYYLDNYHATHFPEWIRNSVYSDRFEISCAYAETEKPGGMTTDEYCKAFGIRRAATPEEVKESCDCFVILAPDETHAHERLATPLMPARKPIFIDKVLADTYAAAKRMAAESEKWKTPLFCASSLRFSKEYEDLPAGKAIECVALSGPVTLEMHIIHQIEILVSLCGTDARRVRGIATGADPVVEVEYPDKKARMAIVGKAPYGAVIAYADGTCLTVPGFTDFFQRSTDRMLEFFMDGIAKSPLNQALHVVALHTAVLDCNKRQGKWIEVEHCI